MPEKPRDIYFDKYLSERFRNIEQKIDYNTEILKDVKAGERHLMIVVIGLALTTLIGLSGLIVALINILSRLPR